MYNVYVNKGINKFKYKETNNRPVTWWRGAMVLTYKTPVSVYKIGCKLSSVVHLKKTNQLKQSLN